MSSRDSAYDQKIYFDYRVNALDIFHATAADLNVNIKAFLKAQCYFVLINDKLRENKCAFYSQVH